MAITKPDIHHHSLATPSDHFALLTGGIETTKHGSVLIGWQPLKQPAWFKNNLAQGQDQLAAYTNEPDIYLTPNHFYGWRLIRLLNGLTAFFVDIDDHTGRRVDMGLMRAKAQTVIDNCVGIPEPNFVVYTGRGIHLYWLIENMTAQALPRWRAVQEVLCAAFDGDRQARDPTRVLRMVGSVNSKTNTRVTGELLHSHRYDFNLLCDEILPYSQTEVRDFRASQAHHDALRKEDRAAHRRAKARYERIGQQYAKEKTKRNRGWRPVSSRWHLVYRDLLTIQNYHWFGGIRQEGHRNQLLFHAANALSWFTVSDSLTAEINATSRIMTPSLSQSEVNNCVSSVVSRARLTAKRRSDAEAAEAAEAIPDTPDDDDDTYDSAIEQRYKYPRATLWAAFEPLVGEHPDLIRQLRAIIPDDLKQEREAERLAKRDRVKEGRYKQGSDDFAKQRREVRKLVSQGLKQVHIAQRLGLSKGRISQIVKELKKR